MVVKEISMPKYTANRKMMTKPLPKELAHASELIDQAKFGEALEIIENFENVEPKISSQHF